ncbi:MAG: ABATE domain-containing protein [Thermoanaerobaculia bacterium]
MTPMSMAETSHEFEMTGGALCLDFANTLGDRPRSTEEHLGSYKDLLQFSRQAGSLPVEALDELEHLSEEYSRKATSAFRRAIKVRETLYRIFGCLACDQEPQLEDIRFLNSELHRTLPQLEIRAKDGAFDWVWAGHADAFDRPLWPVVRSAAELLASEDVTSVRECASETCSWLFVDRSRTRRRRWCDMSTCGNRAKARRHYQRRKQSHGSE